MYTYAEERLKSFQIVNVQTQDWSIQIAKHPFALILNIQIAQKMMFSCMYQGVKKWIWKVVN